MIWSFVNKNDWSNNKKSFFYLASLIVIYALIGAALWFVIGRVLLTDAIYLFCFISYPAVIFGLFGGIITHWTI